MGGSALRTMAPQTQNAAEPVCYDGRVRETIIDALQWDVANWSAALDFWTKHAPLGAATLDCLEIGASLGGISMWLARQGHRVVCSDLGSAEERARPLIERYGVLDRVTFENLDATSIPYADRFDVVVFKSVLGGIGYGGAERQREAIHSMHRALKPGGFLLFAENLTGSALHRYLRSRYIRWGNRWRYVTVDEMRDFLQVFRDVQFGTTGFFGTLGRSETQRKILATLDRFAANALVPPAWHYVIYGVARK